MPRRLLPKQVSFREKPAWARYGVALLLSLILGAFHLYHFNSLLHSPFLFFYPLLFLTSTVLGFGPAVFFLILVGLERNFISMIPSFAWHAPSSTGVVKFFIMGAGSFVVMWIIDNNQTKEVEKNAVENANKLVTFFDTISEIAWTARPDGVMDFYNQRWYEFTGLSKKESLTPSWELALHPDDRFRVVQSWTLSLRRAEPYKTECRFKDRKNKNYRWFLVHVQPVKNSKGQLTQWIGTCTDIDEQKKAQEILQKSGEEFKLITETIPQAIWRTNPDASANYFSRKFYDIVGYALPEYHGWSWLAVIHPEDKFKVKTELIQSHEAGQPFSIECRVLGEDGIYKWFIVMGNPLFEEDKIVSYYGTWTNIDHQKRIEIEMMKTLHSKDEFINIASHELKTPITSLKLQAQIVQRALDKDDPKILTKEKVRQFSDQVLRSISRLNKLVEDMLDFSRIRMDKFSLQPQKVRLDEVLVESLSKVSESFMEYKASIPIIIKNEAVEVYWDKPRLEQVFNNLLMNALKYGQGKPVSISLEKREKSAIFSIKDEGMGIKKDQISKIFDRFERGISASEVSGLGLGLFIARQIIEAQGGKIWVESEENKGSVFFIEFPLKEEV